MPKKIIDINYRNEMSTEKIIENFLHTIFNLPYILFINFSFCDNSLLPCTYVLYHYKYIIYQEY